MQSARSRRSGLARREKGQWWHFYSMEPLHLAGQQLQARLGFDVLWLCSCSSRWGVF